MVTRRAMQSVLVNFLGTYTSRYTDHDGYWLFGFLVEDLDELCIDLLSPPADPHSFTGLAVLWAVGKFEDQLRKIGVPRRRVRRAWLTIRRLPGAIQGSVNDHPISGHELCFLAGAVMDSGLCFESEKTVFVAPHDARSERRSARAWWRE